MGARAVRLLAGLDGVLADVGRVVALHPSHQEDFINNIFKGVFTYTINENAFAQCRATRLKKLYRCRARHRAAGFSLIV
jgi:hypothetical protein